MRVIYTIIIELSSKNNVWGALIAKRLQNSFLFSSRLENKKEFTSEICFLRNLFFDLHNIDSTYMFDTFLVILSITVH